MTRSVDATDPVRARARAAEAELRRVRRIGDPWVRVQVASELLQQVRAEQQAVSLLRDEAVADLRRDGASYSEIAAVTGLTRARVAQIAQQVYGNE